MPAYVASQLADIPGNTVGTGRQAEYGQTLGAFHAINDFVFFKLVQHDAHSHGNAGAFYLGLPKQRFQLPCIPAAIGEYLKIL